MQNEQIYVYIFMQNDNGYMCTHIIKLYLERQVKLMQVLTPIKAIRAKCLECCAGSFKEVRMCSLKNCPLWPYKNGHRPKGEQFTIEGAEIKKS